MVCACMFEFEFVDLLTRLKQLLGASRQSQNQWDRPLRHSSSTERISLFCFTLAFSRLGACLSFRSDARIKVCAKFPTKGAYARFKHGLTRPSEPPSTIVLKDVERIANNSDHAHPAACSRVQSPCVAGLRLLPGCDTGSSGLEDRPKQWRVQLERICRGQCSACCRSATWFCWIHTHFRTARFFICICLGRSSLGSQPSESPDCENFL